MRIGHWTISNESYGPGKRLVIWTQGCDLHCPGCWNQDLWNHEEGQTYTKDNISTLYKNEHIEGVTVLGGEPFDNKDQDILNILRKFKEDKLNVILFTGYEMDEVMQDPNKTSVLSLVDVIITGRYDQKVRTVGDTWFGIGSSNQSLIYTSDVLKDWKPKLDNEVAIEIGQDGSITQTGYPDSVIRGFWQ